MRYDSREDSVPYAISKGQNDKTRNLYSLRILASGDGSDQSPKNQVALIQS